jgi:hypothetical protein
MFCPNDLLPSSFCVNCGKQYDPSHKFCNYCGHLIPRTEAQRAPSNMPENSDPLSTVPDDHAELAVRLDSMATILANPQTPSAPYATFTLWYLAFAFASSCAIFTVAHALGYNTFGDAATLFLIASLLAACFFAIPGIRTWRRIIATAEPKQRPGRVVIKAVVLALLLFTIFAVAGYTIGRNDAEATQITADVVEMRSIGARVTEARNQTGLVTIDSFIQMYKSIEPDVNRLEVVLHKLVTEYPSYGSKFTGEYSSVSKTISDFNVGIHRMDLLKKQIAVAKRMDGLDENTQRSIWRSEMLPLLEQEDALDKSK